MNDQSTLNYRLLTTIWVPTRPWSQLTAEDRLESQNMINNYDLIVCANDDLVRQTLAHSGLQAKYIIFSSRCLNWDPTSDENEDQFYQRLFNFRNWISDKLQTESQICLLAHSRVLEYMTGFTNRNKIMDFRGLSLRQWLIDTRDGWDPDLGRISNLPHFQYDSDINQSSSEQAMLEDQLLVTYNNQAQAQDQAPAQDQVPAQDQAPAQDQVPAQVQTQDQVQAQAQAQAQTLDSKDRFQSSLPTASLVSQKSKSPSEPCGR